MANIIPAQDGLPEIHLFEDSNELRQHLGHAYTHGMFDRENNRIYATPASLSHEIAHFRDYHSGLMPRAEAIKDPATRRRAKIRNEVVAILFSWIKTREIKRLPEHERRFLEWLYFMIDSNRLTPEEPLENLNFSKLQQFAHRVVTECGDQEAVLSELFKHYLSEDERLSGITLGRIRA